MNSPTWTVTFPGAAMALTCLVLLTFPAVSFASSIGKDESLVPEGEKALMSAHPVDGASVAYRPGKGLAVVSGDKAFSMVTRLRLQTLVTVERDGANDVEAGLMLRRARLVFAGNAFGEHNKYDVELAFSPRDLNMTQVGANTLPRESPLLTWTIEFDHLRDLTVKAGQYKIPFSRQRVISSGNQQMVDRSIANAEFNLDRDIGVELHSEDFLGLGLLRYHLGVYNGEGRSAFTNDSTDLMYLARVEVLPLGMFKDYSEGDLERLARPGLSLGVGYAFAPNAQRVRVNQARVPTDSGTTTSHNVTADLTFKWKGFALSSEVFFRNGTRTSGGALDATGAVIPTEAARNGLGWFVQAGYLLPRLPIEFTGRFGQVVAAPGSRLRDENEAGLAASYYLAHHALKFQADVFRLWGPGVGTNQVRAQVQVAF